MINRRESGFTLLEVLVAAVVAVVTLCMVASALGNAAAASLRAARSLRTAVALRQFECLAGTRPGGIPERFDAVGKSWKVSVVEDDPRKAWILVQAGSEDESFRISLPRLTGSGGRS